MSSRKQELSPGHDQCHVEFGPIHLQLAQSFHNIPLEDLDDAIVRAMRLIAEYCHADRAALYRYDNASSTASHLLEWDSKPEFYTGDRLKTLSLHDINKHMLPEGRYIYTESGHEGLSDGSMLRQISAEHDIRALCIFPIIVSGRTAAVIMLSTTCGNKAWTSDEISVIQILTNILSNILIRKEQETAFIEVSRSNQIILDSISEGVGMFDRSGNALQVNRHLAGMFGKSKAACIGMNIRDLLPEEDYGGLHDRWREKLEEAFNTGRHMIFEDFINCRWYNNRLYPVFKDEKITAVTLCSADITDKKAADAEARRIDILEKEMEVLRKKESEYLEILDSSTEATWIKDLVQGTCKYSAQWSKRIGGGGVPTEEMNAFQISLIHPDDKERLLEEKRHICENKLMKYESQYRLKTADGSYIWVLDKGKIIYDESGAPIRIYGTSTDITAQKKSEALILRQNRILKSINMIFEQAIACESVNDLGTACLDIIESITESKASFIGEVGKNGSLSAIAIREPGWGLLESGPTEQISPLTDFILRSLNKGIKKSGKSLLINDPSTTFDSIVKQEGYPSVTSFIGVPFIRDNHVAGLLAAANRKGGFGEEDREMLEAVAPTVFEVLLSKFTEESKRENEFLMRTIMDRSSDFLFIKNRDSRIVMVNQAYGKVFGVDINDVIGKNDYDLYSDYETAKKNIENDQHVMWTGETLICEESAMTAHGLKTYLLSKVPWRDSNGSILGILGIAHDITEQKKAEASLQELVTSLKHSKDYINILYETTGKVLSSPTPRQEITDLCIKVMNFLDCHVFFNYLVEDNQPALRLNACGGVTDAQKLALDNLPLGSAVCGCAIRDSCRIITENIQTTPDPRTDFLRTIGIRAYVCHPLMADGKAIGGLAFGTKSRDQFNEEELLLMRTVAESVAVAMKRKRNEETLLKQAKELLIADHNKNEFLSALSHELRNPMATIMAGLSLLDLSADAAQQEKAKQIMRRQMEYLCRLVDDLLDITRITRNKIVLKKEKFELNNAAAAIADDMKALFEVNHVRLESSLSPSPIEIHADPVRVKQAIGNLLHNALKFTNRDSDVTLSVFSDRNLAYISVKDSGIGINPDFMATIFDPFTQADKSIDRKNGGLGLGLSIVKGIAELHGGSISARSDGPGKGSEFTLCLPISASY